jgi:hypothetical protein
LVNRITYPTVNKEWALEFDATLLNLSIPDGDFVECGSWTGSSAEKLAKHCKKDLHLFDSWEGLSEVGEFDNPIYKELTWKSEIDVCKNVLSEYKNIYFYKGWIPSRFNEIKDRPIALLHLDLSLYQPTKDSLEFFWDKVIPGGWVITNFHEGFSYGAEKAVRDFFNGITEIELKAQGICLIKK